MTNIIRSFDLGFRNVKTIWSMLLTALGDFAISLINNVLKATEDMLNQGRTQMIAFLLQAQQTMGPFFAGPAAGAARQRSIAQATSALTASTTPLSVRRRTFSGSWL